MVRERKRGQGEAGQGKQGQTGMVAAMQPYRVESGQEQQVSGTRLGGAELTGWGIGQTRAINSGRSKQVLVARS